ncbi:hypothetical protein [Enterovirga sp. CN4-39]|uniref:hypothetical protein n=1 Tax=Enterovirga sp. CN4-39 TaxID=3400910 RepID=UPI003C050EC1
MPRRKPAGWPSYMLGKPLRKGGVAYYWNPPTWAMKKACPLKREALGTDYAAAKQRCDDVLNPQFDAWRRRGEIEEQRVSARFGTFDWMVEVYKGSPQYTSKEEKTRKGYDAVLALVSGHKLKDGRTFGALGIASITPGAADRLHEKLKIAKDGSERKRTAILAMRVCQRAWGVAHRAHSTVVPSANPFAKMGLKYKAKPTRPVSFAEMMKLVAAADKAGEPSIGTACMIAYFWLQRQEDILGRLSWAHYQPASNPNVAKIFHHKTGELVDVPLYDVDGSALWPELMSRLGTVQRRGSLIVTRDTPDRKTKVHLPWKVDYFRHRVAKLREAAGIPDEAKFMGLRHGGNVEGADADLTDAQLRALSGHLTTAALLRYAQVTEKQRVTGARKRRDARTKGGGLSE